MLHCSNLAARCNDYLVRAPREEVGKTSLARFLDKTISPTGRKGCQIALARLVAVVAFPVLASMDLIANLARAPYEELRARFAKGEASFQLHDRQSKICTDNIIKCLLGLIATPFGVIQPDIVSRHFIPQRIKEGFIETGGKFYSVKGSEKQPKTVEEVQVLVNQAIKEGKKISISGAHLSQSKDTLPNEIDALSINMKALKGVIIDPDRKVAKVQAGATWIDIQQEANKYGFAVKVMQASNIFSVGGSLSVNCHGWDHRTGTLANTIKSLTIIDANGEKKELKPEDELFGLVIGGHGFFGVIVEAEIDLADNEMLVSKGERIAPKDYAAYFYSKILPDDNHVMHLYRLSLDPNHLLQEGIAVSYSKKTEQFNMPGIAVSNRLDPEPERGTRMDRILLHLGRTMGIFRALWWKIESQNIRQETRLSRNEFMHPPINAAFNNSRADAEWLQEYFVKPADLDRFLNKLSKTLMDNKVPVLNASVRFVKKDTVSHLPYAKGEDHFAIVLFFNQSLALEEIEKTKAWVQEIINDLIEHDGTYYLPYQHFATEEQFSKCYPQTDHIIEMKKKYDPQRLFDNGLYHDYFEPCGKLSVI